MTGQLLTELDVYRIAITNEMRGASFYSSMAANSTDDKTKAIFHKLAEEEKEHHKAFQAILQKAEEITAEPLNKQTASYLKTLSENSVFPVEMNDLVARITPNQALAMGIQAEKDSILLYQELYIHTSSADVKDMLSKLLQEEKLHLVELREQYEELQS
ncbi:ferritin family protein [Desulfoscipio gibsoniae]|uniref:Rubrerythrin diiron-binding domain-containing protein n=1 Tax=Desulfoscipio gibsoniae DSM 7213 TaxID=767817 RepID=R4KCY0_9FIRM|nr:ferritin family protein [Desulfoscipio gibsoniae]AGL00449.1 hypothetical protein Desgi_0901 [Desulfoscipio gibsoniae DSM 7213]